MPGRILLDTNIIIAFFAGEKAVSERFVESEVAVPSIVLGELYYERAKPLAAPPTRRGSIASQRLSMWWAATP